MLPSLKPTIVWLGDTPCSPEVETHFLNHVGSIFRFKDAEELARQWGRLGGSPLPIDGLLCGIHHPLTPETLGLLKGLRVVSSYGAGQDHLPLEWLAQQGIAVFNTPGLLTEATADVAWMLLLMVSRGAKAAMASATSGGFTGWHPHAYVAPGLQGATLGLVGCGRIGQAVAVRAKATGGLRTLYWQRHRLPQALEEELALTFVPSLDELLPQCHAVSLHCPLTEETRHLLNAQRLAAMPAGSFLINTARGAVVDEAALCEALASGHLAGAGLDVYEQEPAIPQALLAHPNVVCLPHIGSATVVTRQAMGDAALNHLLLGLDLPA